MTNPIPRDVLRRVRKLAQLPEEARQSRFAVSVTRLTVLKCLCQDPEAANRFVTYLARKTLERVEQGKGRSSHPEKATAAAHRKMMSEALAGMEAWQRGPAELDMEQYFRVTPPSVHGMVVKLEQLGLVVRQRGVARSVRVAIPEAEIPSLEDVAGSAW